DTALGRQGGAFQMDFSLRERHFDAALVEKAKNLKTEVAEDPRSPFRLPDPEEEIELERGVAEGGERDVGLRVLEDLRMRPRRLEKELFHLIDVRPVGDPDRQMKPDPRVFIRPVDHPGADEVGVGNDDDDVVGGEDRRRADLDFMDIAGGLADGDPVADLHRPLEEKDDPRDEVGGDVLKAEPDSDAEQPRDDRQARQIEADELQPQDQPDEDKEIVGQAEKGVLKPLLQFEPGKDPAAKGPLQNLREEIGAEEKKEGADEGDQGDRRLLNVKKRGVEDVGELDPEGGVSLSDERLDRVKGRVFRGVQAELSLSGSGPCRPRDDLPFS